MELELEKNKYDIDKFTDDILEFTSKLDFNTENKELKKENYTKTHNFLLEYFKDFSNEITFDLKDHFDFDGQTLEESKDRFSQYFFESSLRRIVYMINWDNITKEELKNDLTSERELYSMSNSQNCSKCDCYISYAFDFQDLKIKALDGYEELQPCSIKKELDYKLELEIPSKKIVFTNYFRGILDDDKYKDFSLNSYKGMVEHAKAYEKDNIGYVFVGNGSPSIFIDENKKNIIAGNFYVLEEYEGYKEDNELEDFFENYDISKEEIEKLEKELNGFEEQGYVCTDLWAVTFMDYDQFLSTLRKKGIKEEDYNQDFFIVDIDGTKIEIETTYIENNDDNNKFKIKVK